MTDANTKTLKRRFKMGIPPVVMGFLFVIFMVIYFLSSAIKILREYERGVVFRLGRIIPVKGPGLVIIIPIIDKLVRVSLRTVTMDVPPQDIITRDNITVKVNAVIYFRVIGPYKGNYRGRGFLLCNLTDCPDEPQKHSWPEPA